MPQDLFQFLLDETEQGPMTVSELNAEVRRTVERGFASVWVEGEVVDFKQVGKGHWYFNLNDGTSSVKCVCWGGTNFKIRYKPQNGNTIRVRGRITFWEARGELKLTVESLEPAGEGALRAAFEQIKARLEVEGLFADELKRPIPFLPRRVAVITSRNGAAYHDIHNVLTRHTRSVSILLLNALVQGDGAADSLRKAVLALNKFNSNQPQSDRIDVLIIGRGGGSAEDLWAFNDEALARALRASEIPVISAVGHEIDWTICDLVSDLRAPTPSAAAEMVAAHEEDVIEGLEATRDRLYELIDDKISRFSDRLSRGVNVMELAFGNLLLRTRERFAGIIHRFTPAPLKAHAKELSNRVSAAEERRSVMIRQSIAYRNERLVVQMAKLDALSPLSVLTRGYSITQGEDGSVLRDASAAKAGDKLKIQLERGKLNAEVFSTE